MIHFKKHVASGFHPIYYVNQLITALYGYVRDIYAGVEEPSARIRDYVNKYVETVH